MRDGFVVAVAQRVLFPCSRTGIRMAAAFPEFFVHIVQRFTAITAVQQERETEVAISESVGQTAEPVRRIESHAFGQRVADGQAVGAVYDPSIRRTLEIGRVI